MPDLSGRGGSGDWPRLFVIAVEDADAIVRIGELASSCIEVGRQASDQAVQNPLALAAMNLSVLQGRLTPRQFEIALGVMSGRSNKDIGRELGISHFTVRNHLSHILAVLGLARRQQLREFLRDLLLRGE
ncbi:MAG TPA: helix-turn-helix transcriptional regulator [Novosphingobium sp.]|nr:helix-turn-helix transcriptional regulator [Novosphingobium sp.]HQA17654.1 helix-turn-helix transcriptional regulator [Novosphingobium sp.]